MISGYKNAANYISSTIHAVIGEKRKTSTKHVKKTNRSGTSLISQQCRDAIFFYYYLLFLLVLFGPSIDCGNYLLFRFTVNNKLTVEWRPNWYYYGLAGGAYSHKHRGFNIYIYIYFLSHQFLHRYLTIQLSLWPPLSRSSSKASKQELFLYPSFFTLLF